MAQEKGRSVHASLSEKYVARLKATAAVTDYYDINTPNLCLRVSPPTERRKRALKSWRYAYRYNRVPSVLTFGHYPVLDYNAAVAKACKAKLALYEKKDPRAELYTAPEPLPAPVAEPPVDTVEAMFRRYAKDVLSEKSDTHRRNVTGCFTRHVLKAWAGRDIHSLMRREIVDLVKIVKVDSGPVAANRLASTISAWCNFLVKDGILQASPAVNLPKTKEEPREQILTVPQLVRVWQAADQLGGPAGRFVKLLIATAARRDEAAELPRSEVDDGKQEWLLPANRNKSGRDFLIPLSTLAQNVLAACPNTGRFYFSIGGRNPIGGFTNIKTKLDAIIELQRSGQEPLPHWTFHDLRRSVRTALASLKIDPVIGEKILNHAPARLEQTYDRWHYAPEKREALQLWSDHFSKALREARDVPLAAD